MGQTLGAMMNAEAGAVRCLAKRTAGPGRRQMRRGAVWQNRPLGWDGDRCGVAQSGKTDRWAGTETDAAWPGVVRKP